LSPSRIQDWDDKAIYTWMYQGSQTFNHLMTGLLIISFLAVTCFPIWPKWMKVAIWYCSVTILIIFFIISVIRLVVAVSFECGIVLLHATNACSTPILLLSGDILGFWSGVLDFASTVR
jgi:hypothetical protein